MLHMTTKEWKENAEASFEQISAGNEPVIVTNGNRVLAIVMPFHDPSILEDFEDAMDLAAARRALDEGGEPISLSEIKRELGL